MDLGADGYASFPTTRATLIERACGDNAPSKPALTELLVRYQPALCTHLRLKYRLSPDEAEDLVQGFIADQILARNLISRVDLQKGRFRGYLKISLRNYLVSKARAGDPRATHLDDLHKPPTVDAQADAFDREWALQVIREAVDRMQAKCEKDDQHDLWLLFDGRILGPCMRGEPDLAYDKIVGRFQYQTYSQATKAMTSAKRMFADCLQSVIREYAADDDEVELELLDLQKILAHVGG